MGNPSATQRSPRRRPHRTVAVSIIVVLAAGVTLASHAAASGGGHSLRARSVHAAAAGTAAVQPAPETDPPSAVRDLTATPLPGTDRVRITWAAPTDWGADPADHSTVQVIDVTTPGGWYQFGSEARCAVGGACDRSLTVGGLTDGDRYFVAVWATNAAGTGPGAASAVFTVSTGCAADACVTVDATAAGTPFTGKAAGLIGVGMVPDNTSLLDRLHVSWWRLTTFGLPGSPNPPDYRAFDAARAQGATIIELLSSDWAEQLGTAGDGSAVANPAEHWHAWDSFVKAKVRRSLADGRAPDYWDVWNEPGGDVPPVAGGPLTLDEQLALYNHTWHDIHAVDPHAKLAFASTVGFGEAPGMVSGANADQFLPIPRLLDYIDAHHLTLGLLTWHENLLVQADAVTGFATEAAARVATARRWLDQRHLKRTRIAVDEFLPPAVYGDPGWNLAYLSALEQSQVDGAMRACWGRRWPDGPWGDLAYGGCNWGQLDNLADLGGEHPLAAWWVTELYSSLSGRVVPAPSSSSWIPTLATVDAHGTTTVLVGQASTCSGEIWSSVDSLCAASWTSHPPRRVLVRVHLPHGGTWTLRRTDVANTTEVVPSLSPQAAETVTADADGWVSVALQVPDGAVTQLVLRAD